MKYIIQTLALQRVVGIGPQFFLTNISKVGLKAFFEKLSEHLPAKFLPQYHKFYPWAERKYELSAKAGIKILCIWEKDYPIPLKQTDSPPITIFYKSKLAKFPDTRNFISVVGSRKCDKQGEYLSKWICESIKGTGWGIISGLAFGIDSFVHKFALEAGIRTISVLPSVVEDPTPKSNANLYRQIINNGGIVMSENLGLEEINKYDFPKRNRIIAGLAPATVVVQAGLPSGALITANQAFEYARNVYTFPGNLANLLYRGNNEIIKKGKAQLITDPTDILEIPRRISNKKIHANLDKRFTDVVKILNKGPLSLDDLCVKIDKSTSYVLSLLLDLELEGCVYFNKTINKYELIYL